MVKKEREINLDRLCTAMQRARLMLRRYRVERTEAVRQYVGHHYAEEGTREKVPVNMIALYLSVIGRNLIAKNPRVQLATFHKQSKPLVAAMESWANKEIEHMRLARTLQRVVLDGLFSVGICKVALATPEDAALYAWRLKAGEPFVERVDLDDFVYDVHARDFSEVSFIGHRFRAPLAVVKDSPHFTKARKDLAASSDDPYNLEGDERISTLGRGVYAGNLEEFEDFVDLWEVYLPRHQIVLTLADDHLTGAATGGAGGTGEALRRQRWIGPDSGPYHLLAYGIVPGNAMPKGPVQDLIDLHELINILYRKLGRQAERQKELLAVAGGAMEDGSRVQSANDGEIIRSDNPERMRPMSMGGPHQQNLAFALHIKDLFAYLAGNLDMMGGLSPQSKTATQDKMLEANASKAISDMQDTTVTFTADVLKALCWFWHHNPFKVMRTQYDLPGLPGMAIQRKVTPQQRLQTKWDDLDIEVDPYSMQHSTPQSRVAAIMQVLQQMQPFMGLAQQQGIAIDLNALLAKLAKYLDMPDLADIINFQEPPAQDAEKTPEQPGMPAQTQRNYTRESMPGRTQKGNDMALMNSAMGMDQGGAPQTNGQPAGAPGM